MTFIRSLLKYMYTTRSKDLQTSIKKTSVSVREKKLLRTKNQKTGEEICDGPDTQLRPTLIITAKLCWLS